MQYTSELGLRKRPAINLGPVATLHIFVGFCIGLTVIRFVFTGSTYPGFLLWNLFLAWVPLLLSIYFNNQNRIRGKLGKLTSGLTAFAWLLFLPNSPYLISDLIHLNKQPQSHIMWFDALMFFVFAAVGLTLGLYSFRMMAKRVSRDYGMGWSRLFQGLVIVLTGTGVYLGRELRFNSWDILTKPHELFLICFGELSNPLFWQMGMAYSVLFGLAYFGLLSMKRGLGTGYSALTHPLTP